MRHIGEYEVCRMNRDERLFVLAVLEAIRVCETPFAQAVFVLKKCQRVQKARIDKLEKGHTILDRHRAEHYATSLDFPSLLDHVEEMAREFQAMSVDETRAIEDQIRNFRGVDHD